MRATSRLCWGSLTGGRCSAVKSQVSATLEDNAGSQRPAESLSTLRKDSATLIRHRLWEKAVRLCVIWPKEKTQTARLKCSSALMERKDWVDKSADRQSSGAHLVVDSICWCVSLQHAICFTQGHFSVPSITAAPSSLHHHHHLQFNPLSPSWACKQWMIS